MFISQSKTFHWTYHARDKMRFYRLSEARVKRVLNSPKRIEEGVAPDTVAMMQPSSVKRVRSQESSGGRETWTQEIWVMAQQESRSKKHESRIKIISAWRYPGMSKPKSEMIKNFIHQQYQESASQK